MIKKVYQKLLRISKFRNWVSVARAIWFLKIKRVPIRTWEVGDDVHKPTVFSNKRRVVKNSDNPHPTAKYIMGVDTKQGGTKSDLLLYPLKAVGKVRRNINKLKVLSIGPRTEGEILNIISHGFNIKNITGLDLMSYSPWIQVGDMHNMPFDDDSFDIVICGWVIAYSNNKEKAASEIARVLKSGGIASLGVSYSPLTNEEIIKKRGYLVGTSDRLLSTNAVLELFGDNVGHILFRHDIEESNKKDHGQIITTFIIKK